MGERKRVLLLGFGEMGHAMERLLGDRHRLDIWEKYPQPGFVSVDLASAAERADFAIFCLPVNPHREVARRIEPLLQRRCICISIAKGLDEAGHTAAQIFADVFADRVRYALLYGPMISEEIRAGRDAFAQVGTVDEEVYQEVRDLFAGTRLYLEHTGEVDGITWSVILKNVYALMFGICDELELGDNMRGYLMVAAVKELDRIVRLKGGAAAVPFDLAGLGDLVTTATSKDSHHYQLGRRLARGERDDISGEGIHTLAMVEKYHIVDTAEYPLFRLISRIVNHGGDLPRLIEAHLERRFV